MEVEKNRSEFVVIWEEPADILPRHPLAAHLDTIGFHPARRPIDEGDSARGAQFGRTRSMSALLQYLIDGERERFPATPIVL